MTPRLGHMATLLPDGRVLVAGGRVHFDGEGSDFIGDAELYDPATGMWAAIQSMIFARAGQTATLLSDGRVLIVGGYGSDPQFAELYDPARATR